MPIHADTVGVGGVSCVFRVSFFGFETCFSERTRHLNSLEKSWININLHGDVFPPVSSCIDTRFRDIIEKITCQTRMSSCQRWPRTKKTQTKSPVYVRDPEHTRTRSQSAYAVGLSQNNYIEEFPKYRSAIVYSCTSDPRPFLQIIVIVFF